jgi:quercetin dioxygenase-like cupin family protein
MGRVRAWVWGSVVLAIAVVFAGAVGLGGSEASQADTTAAAGTPAASPAASIGRTILASGFPPAAPGQSLQLARYDIPAGATLAVHVHPGMQTAWIESGELTYHVLKGEAPIGRAATAATPGATETLRAGESTVLGPGDWVVEAPGTVHYGENLTDEPVVILSAVLFEADEPAAVPVNPEGTPLAN